MVNTGACKRVAKGMTITMTHTLPYGLECVCVCGWGEGEEGRVVTPVKKNLMELPKACRGRVCEMFLLNE